MRRSNNLAIVSATRAETRRLVQIIRAGFADVAVRFDLTAGNCPKHPSNCTWEWIERDLARGVQYVILTADGADVGCVGVERASETACYMERLAVLPAHRGKGHGTRLARHAIQQAKQLGVSTMEIGIIAADTGLQRFYESLGFEFGETKTFAHLPFEVAFMQLAV